MSRMLGLWVCALGLCVAAEGAQDRVLFLLADGFNSGEYWSPCFVLRAAGYRVDVAGIARGTVAVSPGKTDAQRDASADLSLAEVKPEDYVGLVIPGGYSPGNLEKHAAALNVCRAFMAAGKPIAAICHGPRLLMRAGLMADRIGTCLFSVANELPDAWRERAYGRYLDQAVVSDRNLLTSRYPGDLPAFNNALLTRLASAGGLPAPRAPIRTLVIAPAVSPHFRWLFSSLESLGLKATVMSPDDVRKLAQSKDRVRGTYAMAFIAAEAPSSPTAQAARAALDELKEESCQIVDVPLKEVGLDGMVGVARAAVRAAVEHCAARRVDAPPPAKPVAAIVLEAGFDDRLLAVLEAFINGHEAPILLASARGGWVLGKEGLPAWAPGAIEQADALPAITLGPRGIHERPGRAADKLIATARSMSQASREKPWTPSATYDAAIVLRPGFDERVVAGMHAMLVLQGKSVVVVGPAREAMRGLNGVTVDVTATYADGVKLSPAATIVAPGGLYPEKSAARQADQPAWIEQQDKSDTQRNDWLLARHRNGATLVLFGLDSLRIGRLEAFKGRMFACTEQAVWSFGKTGGSYSPEPVLRSDERVVSASGAAAIPRVLALLGGKP